MTAREKVLAAEARVRACLNGDAADILCPFCGLLSSPANELLCCNLLADVVTAVIDHVELKDNLEMVERVHEQMAKTIVNLSRQRVMLN